MAALRQEFDVSLTNEYLPDYFLISGHEKMGRKVRFHLSRGTEKSNLEKLC